MPAYPVPPWLHPQDITGAFIHGQQLRAQMEMQQQRLAQEERNAAIAAQVRREQSEREAMLDQQRIEVARAQHQQEAALKMQELEQAKAKIDQASQLAARKYAAMAEYQSRVQGGEDPTKALLELGPMMGTSGGAMTGALRARALAGKGAVTPQFGVDPSGNPYMYNPLTGHAQYSPRRDQGLTQNQILNAKLRMRSEFNRSIPRDPDTLATLSKDEKAAVDDARKQVKTLTDEINQLIKGGAKSDQLIPVERAGKKGFIHADELDAARNEMDEQGNPVYKLPDDIRQPSDEELDNLEGQQE